MPYRRRKLLAAVTLIEVMAAIVIVVVAVLGASGYRYYSALDAKRADMQSAAAQIGLLLCENWRGRGYVGTITFDPVAHLTSANLAVATSGVGPDYGLANPFGQTEITADGVHYWAALSYDDDPTTEGLRMLKVVVAG